MKAYGAFSNPKGEFMVDFFIEVYENIMDSGWHHQHVFPDTPDEGHFNYTIGLYLQGLPELFLSGPVPPELVNDIFHNVIEKWRSGSIDLGFDNDILANNIPLLIMPIDPFSIQAKDEYLCQLHEYREWTQHQNQELFAVQVIYPDKKGNWPTDENFDSDVQQVLLPTTEELNCKEALEN